MIYRTRIILFIPVVFHEGVIIPEGSILGVSSNLVFLQTCTIIIKPDDIHKFIPSK